MVTGYAGEGSSVMCCDVGGHCGGSVSSPDRPLFHTVFRANIPSRRHFSLHDNCTTTDSPLNSSLTLALPDHVAGFAQHWDQKRTTGLEKTSSEFTNKELGKPSLHFLFLFSTHTHTSSAFEVAGAQRLFIRRSEK